MEIAQQSHTPAEHRVDSDREASARSSTEAAQRADRVCDLSPTEPHECHTSRPAIAESAAMRAAFALAERAAHSKVTVMITGETGTGKELIARATHERGPRKRAPFVSVNCAAVPEGLLDAELFGHVRGAFTGAERNRTGLFEEAGAGTLFLDEITEAPASIQAKLLRVLQEREVRPVGATRSRPVKCRIIASSNLDLREQVALGRFREDLFYRLNVLAILVPPLRERPEDIAPLARHFLEIHAERDTKQEIALAADAVEALHAHHWPGNARELENEMARAVALTSTGGCITRDLLNIPAPRLDAEANAAGSPQPLQPGFVDLRSQVERFEADILRRVLERHHGHRSRSARDLGLTREGLYKKMKRLGIE